MKIQRQTFFHDLSENIGSQTNTSYNQPPSQAGFSHWKFKKRSSWVPAPNSLVASLTLCNQRDLDDFSPSKKITRDNLSQTERLAMGSLTLNTNIVIKPADKGSATVILNKLDYIQEGLRQLTDSNFYTHLDSNPTDSNLAIISTFLDTLVTKKEISPQTRDFLLDYKARTPEFYMLPKIHKNKNPPPGRPIISGNNSPTERISQLVDHFLQPLVPKLASFVKDSSDFLNIISHIEDNLPNNALLCTLDVSSLYTNIPHFEGMRACAESLQNNNHPKSTA